MESLRGFPFLSSGFMYRKTPLHEGFRNRFQVGLLALGSTYRPRLPNPPPADSGILRLSSPITATGSLPTLTGFPFMP